MTSPLIDVHGAVAGEGPDAGSAAHYGDPVGEQRAWRAGTGLSDLSHFGIVRVSGEDRLTWLHSLTSQHVEHVGPGQGVEALVLDPAGHIEFAFALIGDESACYLLTEAAAAGPLADYLSSMRFRKRVEVALADDWAALALPGHGPAGRLAEAGGHVAVWRDPWPGITPGGTRYGPPSDEHPGRGWDLTVLISPRMQLAAWAEARIAEGMRPVGSAALEAERIAAWRPRLATEVDARALPAELDWLRTAVHLAKGCYRGQESVAKIHNVGRPPRRLVFLDLDGSGHVLPEPGAALSKDGAVIGQVTSVARHDHDGPIALGLIKRTADSQGVLSVAGPDGEQIAASAIDIVPPSGEAVDRPVIVKPARAALRRRGAR